MGAFQPAERKFGPPTARVPGARNGNQTDIATIVSMTKALCVLLAVLIGATTACAQPAAPDTPRRFRKSVSIDFNPAVNKRINDAKEYIAEKKWQPAVDILHGMLADGEQVLVPLRNGLYVSAERRCNLLVSRLPETGRAVYRRKADSLAKGWFDAALAERSEPGMRRVVRRAFASSYGDDALWHLAQWAWERGDVAQARRYWSRILPRPKGESPETIGTSLRYPATDLDIAAIEARCVLCDLMAGDFVRAKKSLDALKQRAPQARGTIAGRAGRLTDILDGIAREAKNWSFPKPSGNAPTFAVNNRRNAVLPPPVDVGAVLWKRKLDWKSLPVHEGDSGPRLRRHAACYPVFVDGVVFAGIADRVFAYDIRDGSPAFPVGGDQSIPVEDRAVVYPEVAGKPSPAPVRETVGVARFTVTIHKGRLFARLGSPITGRTRNEVRAARSELISYRLGTDTGRLEWKVSAKSFGRGWEFEGSPVVANGKLYVGMRSRFPETQLYVVCFDSLTGRQNWKRRVCTASAPIGDEQNHVTHHLLTLSNGSLFYSTNIGAIAALNATDGSIRWLTTYETRREKRLSDLSNSMKSGFTPCLLARGMLVAAPTDSNKLFGIDPETGVIQWRRALRGGVRHLLGTHSKRLFVSGNRLWALDLHTGRVLWNRGFEDPAGYGYGRGLLAGEWVYWPLRDEILVVKQHNGAIVRRIALRAIHGTRGGNLSIAAGRLVVAEPDRLVVYGTHGGRRKSKPKAQPPAATAGFRSILGNTR